MIKHRATYLKRKFNQQGTLLITTCLILFLYAGTALGSVTSSTWNSGIYTIEATISAPDSVQGNMDFEVSVEGSISGGSEFDVYAYSVYENAVWSYNENHMIEISSGNLVDGRGFNFGATNAGIYIFNKSPGIYNYTYVFGFRKMGHNFFDIAVDITVFVNPVD